MAGGKRQLRIALFAVALALGVLGSAQAAVATPWVSSAKFVRPSANFYAGFGDLIDVRIGGSMPSGSGTIVCVSHVCKGFSGAHVNVAGSYFGQFWHHGTSRTVQVFACRPGTCMAAWWQRQLSVP